MSRTPVDAPPRPAGAAGPRDASLAEREAALGRLLQDLPSLIVAFSGGVDSAYLAYAATRALGAGALCVTADSPSYPDRHRQMALRLARDFGFTHEIVTTGELARAEYRANPANRCYYCKHELYTTLSEIARARGIPAIADGSNADDRGDYRPGRQAAREFGVISPLDAAGLTKADIRELSRQAGLPTWDEPASACLSSRIPYFSEVTDAKLRMIERAEHVLRERGFRICRVRHHGDAAPTARLELAREDIQRALETATYAAVAGELRALGYARVTIDLRGYRLGSLNEALRLRPV